MLTRKSLSRRVFTANSTDTASFTLPADTATKPDPDGTDGYVSMLSGHSDAVSNQVVCEFLGADAAGETASIQCYGVAAYENTNLATAGKMIYHHIPFWEVDITLGTLVTTIGASELYADIIAISQDESGMTLRSQATGEDFENSSARLEFDPLGCEWLFFQVDVGTAQDANILVRGF
jgi:hypothetical protein